MIVEIFKITIKRARDLILLYVYVTRQYYHM